MTRKWKTFLENKNKIYENGKKRIDKDRQKKFIDGRDYTMSVISNIMELSDIISFDTFNKTDLVRGYRNKVVHQDHANKCTAKHCDDAIGLALDLLSDELPIKLLPPQSYLFPAP